MTTMAKPRILVTRKLPDEVEHRLTRDFSIALNPLDTPMTAEKIIAQAAHFDALLIASMDKCRDDVINALPASIRMIATFSVGTDHIDIPAAKIRGIAVTNTPDVLTDATADISMLLVLGAARGAIWGDAMVRRTSGRPHPWYHHLDWTLVDAGLEFLAWGVSGKPLQNVQPLLE